MRFGDACGHSTAGKKRPHCQRHGNASVGSCSREIMTANQDEGNHCVASLQLTFGQRLSAALSLSKVSRQELADSLGISVQAIGQVINGQVGSLSASHALKASLTLGVSLPWLISGEGPMQNHWPSVSSAKPSPTKANPGVLLAITFFGSAFAMCKALGVSPQAVCFWRDGERKFPAELAPTVERLTGGSVRCEFLCPDVEWSVLRDSQKEGV